MNKETIVLLLESIYKNNMIQVPIEGHKIIDAVDFAVTKDLVTRTEMGNFAVSEKGLGLMCGLISWENI